LVKISFHDTGSKDNKLSYGSQRYFFILIVYDPRLKSGDRKANGSGPGLATEGVLHAHRGALGQSVSFVDGGTEAILESAKHLDWKRGPTRDAKPKAGSPRGMEIG
jgi:hypothetical protein